MRAQNGFIAHDGVSNENAVTSMLALYKVVKNLYPRDHATWPKFQVARRARPRALDEIYQFNLQYWKTLIETVAEYKAVFEDGTKKSSAFRKPNKNHLLFRPVGQFAFARATMSVMSSGKSMAEAIDELYDGVTPWLGNKAWHHIHWDPNGKRILNNEVLAETLLLTSAGFPARSVSAQRKLDKVQALKFEE